MPKFYVTLKSDGKRYQMYHVQTDKVGKLRYCWGEIKVPKTDVGQMIFPHEIVGDLEVVDVQTT